MSVPFLWGSPFALPSGIQMPDVTALSNGTFLVIGKSGAAPLGTIKAWIYNADGSLKAEQVLNVPDPGPRATNDSLDLLAINPLAAELSNGRIAITWTVNTPNSGGTYVAPWTCIYDGNLKPVGIPKPVFETNGGDRDYAEAVVGLNDGSFVISDRNEKNGHAYLRVFSPDGVRSPALDLGPAGGSGLGAIVTDVAALSNGKAAIVVRTDTSTLTGYMLTPSGSGGPSLSAPFKITLGDAPAKGDVKVTALQGGGFVVTWVESGSPQASEPDLTVRFKVYDAQGTAVRDEPFSFYASAAEAGAIGAPDVVALPDGGFALAAQVSPNTSVPGSEVRLAVFNASGSRLSDKLLVSNPAAEGTFSLKELSLLADGRIAVHMSNGFQIVDPRDKAVLLKGTAGNDQFIGTAFNDTFEGSAGADILTGGDGIDFVSFANAKAGVTASVLGGRGGDAAGDTYISIEGLIGSSYNDVLIGGGSGILKGGAGNDRITAFAGNDKIYGDEGKDTLSAGSGSDTLYGGAGNDRLYGGTGSGKDVFVFDTRPNKSTNVDRVYDFNPKYDSIWLENSIFTKIGKGSLEKPMKIKASLFFKGTAAHDKSDRIIYDNKSGALYYDKDGTGSAAKVKIAALNKGLKLTYHDFFVI